MTESADVLPLLTTSQVAQRLAVDEETVRRLARAGRLPAIRIGGRLRFDRAELDQYVERSRVELPPPPAPRVRQSQRRPVDTRDYGSASSDSVRERLRRRREAG